MATNVTLTESELFERIGRLQVECVMRAQREDTLQARIRELEETVKALEAPKGSKKSQTE